MNQLTAVEIQALKDAVARDAVVYTADSWGPDLEHL